MINVNHMDMFYACGCLRFGAKSGEHKHCPKCAGNNGKDKQVFPHSYIPVGDRYEPNQEHWIATNGYSVKQGIQPNERLDALKRSTLIEILNWEDCCPNYEALMKLGPPKSDERVKLIRDHLIVLIEHPQWAQGKSRRQYDLEKYDEWIEEGTFEYYWK